MYENDFYQNRHEQTVYAAQRILGLVREIIPPVRSAVDVGCGVGTWLTVLQDEGADTLRGYDGDWVSRELLRIPPSCFTACDLNRVIEAPASKFDLAISLEVAEHLPESSARDFVTTLTNQSDFVLFSAAIPGQGGEHHVNEQWLEYWTGLFSGKGFTGLDVLRKPIWHDERIAPWYRQNAVLFAACHRLPELHLGQVVDGLEPVSLVHPAIFSGRISHDKADLIYSKSIRGSVRNLGRAAKTRISRINRVNTRPAPSL